MTTGNDQPFTASSIAGLLRPASGPIEERFAKGGNWVMVLLRILSGLFLLAAALALIAEATYAQLGVPGAPFTPVLKQLNDAAPKVLQAMEQSVSSMHPMLWDPLLTSILQLPAWISLGSIGLVLGWLGRRRYQRINVFTN